MRPQLRIIQGVDPIFRFRLPDGKVITGDTYGEIVQAMSEEKLSTPRSLRSYRRAVARRMSSSGITSVPTHDNRHFVLSLVNLGVLQDLTSSDN